MIKKGGRKEVHSLGKFQGDDVFQRSSGNSGGEMMARGWGPAWRVQRTDACFPKTGQEKESIRGERSLVKGYRNAFLFDRNKVVKRS